jgi:NADH-quinone oxidoreductase subunit K
MLSIEHYLVLSLALFAIGVGGVLLRRNVIVMLMSIELMLNAVTINLVAFSRLHGSVDGQAFAVFIIVAAAAEAVVGLGIMLVVARGRETLNSEDMDLLKW